MSNSPAPPMTVNGWDVTELMTPQEVAAAFGVNTKTVIRWTENGHLVAVRTLGGHRRFSREQVMHLRSKGGGWADHKPSAPVPVAG